MRNGQRLRAAQEEAPDILAAKRDLRRLLHGRYTLGKFIGQGGAGIVFEARQTASHALRVAKILSPSARAARESTRIGTEFREEARKLANLCHPNLVTVFDQAMPKEIPYFIMEYVNGNDLDKIAAKWARRSPRGAWLEPLQVVFLQLASVLDYLHARKPALLHLDIKPENVRISEDHRNRPQAILLDFGISRFADFPDVHSGQVRVLGTFRMWPESYRNSLARMSEGNRSVFVIDRKKITPALDLHLLGRTIREALDIGKRRDPYRCDSWNRILRIQLRGLEEIVARLDIDKPEFMAFESAEEISRWLRKLAFPHGRVGLRFDTGFLRLPGTTVNHYGQLARRITDWPKFQRLRGVLQLGLAYLVYPGATHTRFEHSLGTFANAIQVLDSITGPSGEHRFRSLVSDEELVATALLALLHDVGHYPFAHHFRIAGQFPVHESRTLEVLRSAELEERVRATFGRQVYAALVELMEYIVTRDTDGARRNPGKRYPPHYRVLRDVVASSVDVDKLDYVTRDALHAGVPYGRIIDYDRFMASLAIWWGAEGPCLLPSDKGRACAEALVFARYLMTSEVYWNHAVRAYAAMMSGAIRQLDPLVVRKHLWDTDQTFLAWLGGDKRTKWLIDLIDNRKPYRRAFVHQKLGGKDDGDIDSKLFAKLENAAEEADSSPNGGDQQATIRNVVKHALGSA